MDGRSDAELLLAARTDASAFRVLYDRWSTRLLAYFYRRTFDVEESADLVAETFAVAWLRRHRFQDIGAEGGAWLYGIARRELGRWRRRRRVELRAVRRMGVVVPEMDDTSLRRVEELVDLHRFRAELDSALARLTRREREAVRLRVLERRPFSEVATLLGCSEGAARVRVHRALGRLEQWIEAPP